jgi:hypothetical protein
MNRPSRPPVSQERVCDLAEKCNGQRQKVVDQAKEQNADDELMGAGVGTQKAQEKAVEHSESARDLT